jgi:hypothetical protein
VSPCQSNYSQRVNTDQAWQTTDVLVVTGLVTVHGQLVMVRVVAWRVILAAGQVHWVSAQTA